MLNTIELEKVVAIAHEVGDANIEIHNRDFQIEYEKDKSPLSEENKEVPYEKRKHGEYYWWIDTIDGTKEFIKKNGECTVNIALIHKDTPVPTVVYAPEVQETQDFIDDLVKGTEQIEQVYEGTSLKFFMLTEGSADIYPRLTPTMKWDTATVVQLLEGVER